MYIMPAATNIIQGFFRGMGDLKITLISTITNMSFRFLSAYLFIRIWGGGFGSLAWANFWGWIPCNFGALARSFKREPWQSGHASSFKNFSTRFMPFSSFTFANFQRQIPLFPDNPRCRTHRKPGAISLLFQAGHSSCFSMIGELAPLAPYSLAIKWYGSATTRTPPTILPAVTHSRL